MAARDFVKWRYTTKNGKTFVRRADAFITAQVDGGGAVKVGGVTTDGTENGPMPQNYRPRRWHGQSTAGYKGSVVCYDEAAPLLTDHALTIDVRDAGGTTHTLLYVSDTGERRGRGIG